MRTATTFLLLAICASTATAQYYSDEHQEHLKGFWPSGVEFPAGGKFYDLPQAYQHGGGVHSVKYNIAANPDPFGNANREFPWGFPAGTHAASGWASYKLLALPPGKKIIWWTERTQSEPLVYQWAYPDGTIFGEMLLVKDKEGYYRAFEVRIAEKTAGQWNRTPYRPIAKIEDLPEGAVKVTKRIAAYPERAYKTGRDMMVGSPRATFGADHVDVELWDVGTQDPKKWLSKPFKASRVMYTSDGSITPKGFMGNVTQCSKCHTQAGAHTDDLDRAQGFRREWYGHVRGKDTIYSHHIFDPKCINGSGFSTQAILSRELPLERYR